MALQGIYSSSSLVVQAKQQAAKLMKDMSATIRATNLQRNTSPSPPPSKLPSSLDRARAYSKTVPKPRLWDDQPALADEEPQEELQDPGQEEEASLCRAPSELRKLEQQHVIDQRTVERIRSIHGTAVS